ncbi:hypothetical protein D9M71_767940 [compost metagenome]
MGHGERLAVEQVAGRVLGVQLQPIQGEMLGSVYGMGPGQMAVKADVDQRQPRQGRAHDIQFARQGQLHLIETHAACPGKMRVGQEHATAIE